MNCFPFCWPLFLATLAPLSAAPTNLPPVTAPALAAAPTPALAAKPDPFSDPLIRQVQARHEKAVAGDPKETQALAADLEKWTSAHPENHLLQAYLGSTDTLLSRDAWPGPSKLTYLKTGGHLLNAAVAADPQNPGVRFIRAIDFFELPAIFGQRQVARDDFDLLVRQIEGRAPCPFSLDTPTQQAIYLFAGRSYQQLSQPARAKEAWQRGWNLDPTSALAGKIKAELGGK